MHSQFDFLLLVRSLKRRGTAFPVAGLVIFLLVCARADAGEHGSPAPAAKSKGPATSEKPKYLIFWSVPEKAGELAERVGMKGDGKTRLLGFGLPTPTYELDPMRLWESAFSKEAIAAYHKFLMGQPLVEKSISIDHPQFRIQAKIKRVAAGIARWHGSGKDPRAVGKLMERAQPLADAGRLVELEKLVDQALEMLGETEKVPDVYRTN
jgi:hypothetical protein